MIEGGIVINLTVDLEQLVEKVKQGDGEAFYDLVNPIYSEIYRIAYVYVHNDSDTIDILQQSMIKAFENISSLKEPRYFKTWLIRIVINCSKTYIEKMKKVVITAPEELTEIQSNVTSYKEEEIDLLIALRKLEEKYKTVLILRFYQDYTVPEIAHILNTPLGTVKTNIRRGLLELKKLMKGVYMDEWIQSIEGNDE